MNLQQAIEIIKSLIDGVQCNGPDRRKIENAFAVIVEAATKPKEKKKVDAEYVDERMGNKEDD